MARNATLAPMHCRLLVTDVFPTQAAFGERLGERRLHALETLVARGLFKLGHWQSLDQWLLESFAVARQQDWPSAPYALLGDGGAPGTDFWVHADPVHLRVEHDQAVLVDASQTSLSSEEAQGLTEHLNRHFGDTLRIYPLRARRWYARLVAPPEDPTLPLGLAAGRELETGAPSIRWQALMNEAQMLLHEHPLNAAREARGEPVINGIWLWGGGRLGEAKARGLSAVFSEHPLAAGLAACTGIRSAPLPERAEHWIEGIDRDGVYLAVIESLSVAARYGDAGRWIDGLEAIERNWFAPLAQAIGRGRVGMVTLHLSGARSLLESETTRLDMQRVWRRRKAMHRYFAAGSSQ